MTDTFPNPSGAQPAQHTGGEAQASHVPAGWQRPEWKSALWPRMNEQFEEPHARENSWRHRVWGMLLGGAQGDALGAPIENLSIEAIRERWPNGVRKFVPWKTAHDGLTVGAVTDDTQMTCFTMEGLIRGWHQMLAHGTSKVDQVVHRAYLRWLRTQTPPKPRDPWPYPQYPDDGWLISQPEMHYLRGPGRSCLTALQAVRDGAPHGTPERPINDSKGSGGVMRAAPVAVWRGDDELVFSLATRTAFLTHGNPSGYLPAAVLAVICKHLLAMEPIDVAITRGRKGLLSWSGHEETLTALDRGLRAAESAPLSPEQMNEQLGRGFLGHEALSIAVYAALCHQDNPREAIVTAANHSGDSDTTAAITGNIVGALHGATALRPMGTELVELDAILYQLALDASTAFEHIAYRELQHRYPAN